MIIKKYRDRLTLVNLKRRYGVRVPAELEGGGFYRHKFGNLQIVNVKMAAMV